MSFLSYVLSVASSLVPSARKNNSSLQFFPEVDTVYIDSDGNATSLKTVLPSIANCILERLLDPNDPIALQIICVLQPSCYSYSRLLCAHQNGWLRRFVEEIAHIKSHLQVFVVYSPHKTTTFVPYKHLEDDLNGVPTIVFTHQYLAMLQSATSIDEENAILAIMFTSFLREFSHLLLYRRRYLSKKTFETLYSQEDLDIQEKIMGGTCSLVDVEIVSDSNPTCSMSKQRRLMLHFSSIERSLVAQDNQVERLLKWITGTATAIRLDLPFFRPSPEYVVGPQTHPSTMAMVRSARIRVLPDVHHRVYMVDSPLPYSER